jgi:hypothetical protein
MAALAGVACENPVGPEPLEPADPRSALVGGGISGTGAIGLGAPIPGADWQDFAFVVSADAVGTLHFSDYSVVRNGIPGRIIADPTADPPTGVTSYQRVSDACVRFGGTGRIDTGQLWQFWVDVCDYATPGAGFDTFTITLPDRAGPGVPYVQSGTLRTGDIAMTGVEVPLPGLSSP